MSWIFFATLAYFLTALQTILDKFLLSSKRVSHPAIYAFYSGLLSLSALLLFPFGFHWVDFREAIFSLASGMIFIYGILSLFFALSKNEASRVTPVVGAVTPIATFCVTFFAFGERLDFFQMLGVVFLVAGGLFISLKIKKGPDELFGGFGASVLAGILLALSFSSFDRLFQLDQSFVNVYIWTRFGLLLGAISLFGVPSWRRAIWHSFRGFEKPKGKNYSSGSMFVGVKILGGVASIILNYAIKLGAVTIVNAMISLEYAFVFLFGIFLSSIYPKVFQEKRTAKNIFQKTVAILIIAAGIFLVSR